MDEKIRATGRPRQEARKRAAKASLGKPYPDFAYGPKDVTQARLEALAIGLILGLLIASSFWITW